MTPSLLPLLSAATPRPWVSRCDVVPDLYGGLQHDYVILDAENMWVAKVGDAPDNAALIVTAVNSVEGLLSDVERLTKERDLHVDAFAAQKRERDRILAERDTARAEVERLRALLASTVTAWESLPGNRRHKPADIERWLGNEMAPAINAIRAAIGGSGE